jgi:hypothetical protein
LPRRKSFGAARADRLDDLGELLIEVIGHLPPLTVEALHRCSWWRTAGVR